MVKGRGDTHVELEKKDTANTRLNEGSLFQIGADYREKPIEHPILQPFLPFILIFHRRHRFEDGVK